MQTLKDILFGVSLQSLTGDREVAISGVAFDSRKVEEGFLFVAIKGLTVDGHDYIEKAIELGASVVVCETLPADQNGNITFVQTNNAAEALGIIASLV